MNVIIEAIRQTVYQDLSDLYEQKLDLPCEIKVGDVFISYNGEKPALFCEEAWKSVKPFVQSLAKKEGNFFDGWMKNPYQAVVSCNDGIRPMSFLITLDLSNQKK